MIVTGQYCPGTLTSWAIGIALVEGDDDCQALPTWPLRWKGREGGYSPILEIDAPDDVAAELIYAGED